MLVTQVVHPYSRNRRRKLDSQEDPIVSIISRVSELGRFSMPMLNKLLNC